MCLVPLIVGGAIVGGVGAYNSSKNAQRQAEAIAAFKERKFLLARIFGAEAYHRFTLEVHTRHRQEHDTLTRQVSAVQATTQLREGRIAASAGGAGVAGTTVALELQEEQKAEQRALGDIRLQREFSDVSAELQLRAGRATIREKITAAEPSPTQQISDTTVILNTISGALGGGAGGQSLGSGLGLE